MGAPRDKGQSEFEILLAMLKAVGDASRLRLLAIVASRHAIQPNTDSFRDFPDYAKQHLDPARHRKVAMFCTGGIRCEKSTAYLRQQGFDQVYHLQGGILKYLEEVPETNTRWHGECFVFDNRVSVNHALEKGSYDQCHACRLPITDTDKASNKYQAGVSCPACYGTKSSQQRAGFREREKQVRLAGTRGELHIGADAVQKYFHPVTQHLVPDECVFGKR